MIVTIKHFPKFCFIQLTEHILQKVIFIFVMIFFKCCVSFTDGVPASVTEGCGRQLLHPGTETGRRCLSSQPEHTPEEGSHCQISGRVVGKCKVEKDMSEANYKLNGDIPPRIAHQLY